LLGGRRLDQPVVHDRIETCFSTATVFRDVVLPPRADERPPGKVKISGSLIPASGETALMLLSLEVAGVRSEGVIGEPT
jgi:hypothetical protein